MGTALNQRKELVPRGCEFFPLSDVPNGIGISFLHPSAESGRLSSDSPSPEFRNLSLL